MMLSPTTGLRCAMMAAAAWLGTGSLAAAATPIDGPWAVNDLILNIYGCDNMVCGKVAWVKDPLRRRKDCGKTIVWGLSPSGANAWGNGSIYDTTDGNTYRLNATLEPDGTLNARIFRGIPLIGKTEILRRVATKPQPDWC